MKHHTIDIVYSERTDNALTTWFDARYVVDGKELHHRASSTYIRYSMCGRAGFDSRVKSIMTGRWT